MTKCKIASSVTIDCKGKQITANTFLFNQIVQNDHGTESYIYFVMR